MEKTKNNKIIAYNKAKFNFKNFRTFAIYNGPVNLIQWNPKTAVDILVLPIDKLTNTAISSYGGSEKSFASSNNMSYNSPYSSYQNSPYSSYQNSPLLFDTNNKSNNGIYNRESDAFIFRGVKMILGFIDISRFIKKFNGASGFAKLVKHYLKPIVKDFNIKPDGIAILGLPELRSICSTEECVEFLTDLREYFQNVILIADLDHLEIFKKVRDIIDGVFLKSCVYFPDGNQKTRHDMPTPGFLEFVNELKNEINNKADFMVFDVEVLPPFVGNHKEYIFIHKIIQWLNGRNFLGAIVHNEEMNDPKDVHPLPYLSIADDNVFEYVSADPISETKKAIEGLVLKLDPYEYEITPAIWDKVLKAVNFPPNIAGRFKSISESKREDFVDTIYSKPIPPKVPLIAELQKITQNDNSEMLRKKPTIQIPARPSRDINLGGSLRIHHSVSFKDRKNKPIIEKEKSYNIVRVCSMNNVGISYDVKRTSEINMSIARVLFKLLTKKLLSPVRYSIDVPSNEYTPAFNNMIETLDEMIEKPSRCIRYLENSVFKDKNISSIFEQLKDDLLNNKVEVLTVTSGSLNLTEEKPLPYKPVIAIGGEVQEEPNVLYIFVSETVPNILEAVIHIYCKQKFVFSTQQCVIMESSVVGQTQRKCKLPISERIIWQLNNLDFSEKIDLVRRTQKVIETIQNSKMSSSNKHETVYAVEIAKYIKQYCNYILIKKQNYQDRLIEATYQGFLPTSSFEEELARFVAWATLDPKGPELMNEYCRCIHRVVSKKVFKSDSPYSVCLCYLFFAFWKACRRIAWMNLFSSLLDINSLYLEDSDQVAVGMEMTTTHHNMNFLYDLNSHQLSKAMHSLLRSRGKRVPIGNYENQINQAHTESDHKAKTIANAFIFVYPVLVDLILVKFVGSGIFISNRLDDSARRCVSFVFLIIFPIVGGVINSIAKTCTYYFFCKSMPLMLEAFSKRLSSSLIIFTVSSVALSVLSLFVSHFNYISVALTFVYCMGFCLYMCFFSILTSIKNPELLFIKCEGPRSAIIGVSILLIPMLISRLVFHDDSNSNIVWGIYDLGLICSVLFMIFKFKRIAHDYMDWPSKLKIPTEVANEIIECDGNTCNTKVSNVGYYINGGSETVDATTSETTYSQLIQCTEADKVCTLLAPIPSGYFVDASSAIVSDSESRKRDGEDPVILYTKLIFCENDGTNPVKCELVSEIKEGYYINAVPDSQGLFTDALIKCSDVDGTLACQLVTQENENSMYIDNSTGKLIQCSEDAKGCKAFAGTGTSIIPAYYINAAVPSDEDYKNLLIQCSDEKCDISDAVENGVYINGNFKGTAGNSVTNSDSTDDENQLIICSEGTCIPSKSEPESGTTLTYLNSGNYTDTTSTPNKSYPLINCTDDSGVTCTPAEVTLGTGSSKDVFYRNGNYDPENKPTVKEYLIKCTSEESCVNYGEATAEGLEHYIHGGQTSKSDAIIECTLSGDESVTAECVFIDSDPPEANFIYINSADNNLIQCYGSTVKCEAFNGVTGSSDVPAYFVNAAGGEKDDYEDYLIKCTGEGSCELANGVENGIFINSNFKEKDSTVNTNGDAAMRLISCTESDKCIVTEGNANSYYVNSGALPINPSKREDTAYTNSLIFCPSTATSPCTPTDAGEDNVYLNGNKDNDENMLIICNNNNCASVSGVASDGNEYYVNSGASASTKLDDTLITCDSSECNIDTTTIKPKIKEKVTELFLKNNNYGLDSDGNEKDMVHYLIKCTSEEGCVPFGYTDHEDGDVEHYVNGAGSSLSDTLIEVTFASPSAPETPEERKRSEPNLMATIEIVEDVDPNDIYINSSTGKLIQCSSACIAFSSTGTANVPAYYVNAAAEEDKSYKNYIIKCTERECTLLNSINDNDVFINANLKDTTDGATENPVKNEDSTDSNQLIVCSNNNCTPVASVAETNKDEYYLNAGEYSDGTNTLKLIKCTYNSSVTCDAEKVELGSGVSEVFYINGNYDPERDSQNYLIKCTSSSECETYKNEKPEVGNEHYVHGSPDTENPLKNAIIECKMEEAGASGSRRKREGENNENEEEEEEEENSTNFTATCELLEDAKENNIYINAFKTQQIIRCISSGCSSVNNESTEKSSGYYINTDKDENKNLIKCTTEECKMITSDELKEIEGKKVFVNANYLEIADNENPLIKCDNAGACSLDISNATDEDPEFYINADKDKDNKDYDGALNTDIIKCTFNGEESKLKVHCDPKALTAKIGDVFLNSDFDESTNVKQIITCTSEGCVEAAAYGEEDDSSSRKYYINAGSNDPEDKLQDTLIECTDPANECTIKPAKPEGIYINSITNELIICSDKSNGCKATPSKPSKDKYQYFLNSSNLEYNPEEYIEDDLIKCFIGKDGKNKCVPESGKDKKVYINSNNPSQVIYCLSGALCKVKDSTAQPNSPQYFVNGDTIDFESENSEEGSNETENKRKREEGNDQEEQEEAVDSDPLGYDLIKCSVKSGTTIVCDVANGEDGNVYINGNYDASGNEGDSVNHLIKCSEEKGCIAVPSNASDEKLPEYYINSGNEGRDKFNAALIQCIKSGSGITCDTHKAEAYQIYRNDNENQMDTMPLIKCSKNSCNKASSGATKDSKEYYLNSGNIDDTPKNYDIIECAVEDNKSKKRASESSSIVVCTCKTKEDTGDGVYINSNYSESGDNNQLIKCSKDNGCEGIKSESTNKVMEYYVNAESEGLSNAIIFCANKKCEKQSPVDIPTYYVGKDEDNVNGLIECVQSTISNEEETDDDIQDTDVNGETSQIQRKRASESTVKKCTLKPAFSSQGYYLNSGYNKATNQTILCDSTDGCNTLKVDLGYYVNAGNPDKPIIKCEKEGNECIEEESPDCPESKDAKAGNYCFADNQLKFYPSSNSTAISASKSDDCYSFATIPVNGFPGIRTETGSLFKISRYFINRYYQSGVVMIDKNGKLVDTLTSDQSDISLYDCNDSTKICSERPGCTSNTYMFDSENRKAVFCNSGKMEYAQISGYVVDGTRVTGGSKHPYIIYCESNGEKCQSFKPKVSTYYENSGYDSSTNSLIQCSNNNCVTVPAEAGYYVGHGENGNSGIIKCTSATTCTYSQIKSKVKYVNAGSDKTSYAIIECTKTNGCSVSKARTGYYLTYTSTLLIQCTSPTSCSEFTPTVNYYDNADSSESSSTIINCVQNSSVVTCATEATNNGFYLSSLSNVLIRCKAGSKCKTITVKNGIFRGALKGLTSNSRRSEDEEEFVKESKVREEVSGDLEDDGKVVSLRDNDDAYGIIRCVAGKCSALSPTELAAIPMCEFNNNKCYITLEYAMTKSATTSISAGNICTNSDRSVFYFATDTIVVKPNVISGVTATYIYTTTNSNCLEVNDSYDDMYFTVGSNIYMLDQGSVLQFYETGYYFLNVAKNILVNGNDIDAYNDENVKLYRCNGSSCSIVDKPESITYYADVNKRILKYNVNNDAYAFAYERDIICIFANNKCTPNADLKNQEFCITYKGELVLAKTDIKNRETGECYRASSISSTIYGYSQYLYNMNLFAAQMVDHTGYYIISLSTNTTVVSKNYKTKNNSLVVYGCTLSSCKVYEPDEDTYYYDAQAKTILRYKDGVWNTPSTSGYAYISIDPLTTYIYKFTKTLDEIKIQSIANYGYYYTVDNEMYHCDQDEDGACTPISETGYYFTNSGEIYYCIHDSEELEATECTKQACISGQYYYIDDAYYRCEVSSLLVPVVSRYCSYDDNVIINFPLALTEEFPDKIKQAVDGIQKNNNSTAIVSRRGKNYLEAVSGIFTNCTYNVEETKSTFDLVCVNNFVTVDKESDEVKICSIEQLGYVECIEDEDNPEKCNVSAANALLKPSLFIFISYLLITLFFNF